MSTTPLNALRAFEAVARLGSFKAAADALFVTQSAISHQIRHVEDWLGKPLFAREGNRTRLLDEGAELAASLSIAFGEIDSACRRARNRGGARTLVIAAIPSVSMCWLIPRLSRFRAEHPEIEFRIVYAMHGRDIDFDAVHLAFVFGDLEGPEPPLVRVHVERLPDDLLGFATDTAAPFHAAMDALAREGRGVLVYLRRDAIAQVQQSPSDREVGLGAQLLGHLGIRRMRLLSRQEKKYIGLHGFGLEITATVPLDAL